MVFLSQARNLAKRVPMIQFRAGKSYRSESASAAASSSSGQSAQVKKAVSML
jgi:hypothetical protein